MKTKNNKTINFFAVINKYLSATVLMLFMLTFFSLGASSTAYAEDIITNTATANFSINGVERALSDSIQFKKDVAVAPTDEITLQKRASSSNVYKGDTVTYTLDVGNPNSKILDNVVIQDTLPPGIKLQLGTIKLNNALLDNQKVHLSGNKLSITLGNIPAKTNWLVSYKVDITSIGTLVNQAYALSDTVNSRKAEAIINATDRPAVIVPIELNKQADSEKVKLNGIINYSLTIKNPNEVALKNIEIKDTLPNGLVYIVNSAKLNNVSIAASTTNGLSFFINEIPASTTWKLSYKTQLDANAKIGELINKARITTDTTEANSKVATSTVEVINYQIGIDKVANKQTVAIDETVTYTIDVNNPESQTLTDLVIEDTLPKGFVYIPDTAIINSLKLSSSAIQINNSHLTFSIGSLAKGSTTTLSYQVKVTKDANAGDAINSANAKTEIAQSSVVTATVKVRTPSTIEFLKIDNSSNGEKSVIPPTFFNDNRNGGKTWQEVNSVTLPNGTKIDLPSSHHVVETDQYNLSDPIVIQVTDLDQNKDPNKIETIIVTIRVPGTNDTEVFLLKETAPDSGIFRGLILTTTDAAQSQNGKLSLNQNSKITVTYRDEGDSKDISASAALVLPDVRLVLTKKADKKSATAGELVRYTLTFKNTTSYDMPNVVLNDSLPAGLRIEKNSLTLNGKKITQSANANRRTLSIPLGTIKAGAQWTIKYLAKITTATEIGDAINSAQITSGKYQSNIARATVVIKDLLMRNKNILTGRVYIGCETNNSNDKKVVTLKNARIYLETGRNVLSDKEGFWHMEGVNPGKHVLQLDTSSLPSGYEPILCYGNTRYAKNSKSRFVDLQPGTLWQVDFHVKKVNNVETTSTKIKKKVTLSPTALYGSKYLKSASDEFEILWPKNNYVPPVASTKIYVKSSPKYKVEVYLNEKKVSPLNYDGSSTNKTKTATIRRWLGVDIDVKRKNNTLLAILKNKAGKEIARKTHNIRFSSEPASAEFLESESILVADGKTIPVLTLRIKDEDGFPMRANTHGYVTLKNSGFSIKTQNNDKKSNLNETLSGNYKYHIEEGGIAHIELNPTTQSGEVKLELKFSNSKNKTITAWLKPKLREWILVGIAEGTAGYGSLRDNVKSFNDLDKEADEFYKNGRIAFFAKGKVRGQYLLTLAYDTHKKKRETGSQRHGNIDPDAWYTVYADNSRSQYEAPSSRKLYVKVEKDTFYALFGDYQTGMNITELAKFERRLTGIKSEYKGKNLSYNAFISETSDDHHHDEIPGDGTSGLYHLTSFIIPNSESIRIETRDRFHSERIVDTRQLVRYQDYDIDYEAGTLFFKFPITGRDSNFNPNIIIVDYDTESDSNKNIVAGGRIAVNTNDEKLEVGVSTLQMTRKGAKNDSLIAVDATYKITPDTKIHAEIAQSNTFASHNKSVNAQILEVEKDIANLEAKLYYRKQGGNFGIDSQASETGTQKIGAELNYKLNDKTSINAEVSKQDNLSNDNERKLAEVGIKQRYDRFEINSGVRHSTEKTSGNSTSNNTMLLGGSYTTENGKVTFRSNIEKNLKSKNQSENSPDRALVGVDVKLNQGLTLFAEHEITQNDNVKTQNSRVGVSKNLWKGAKGKTTFTQERTDQGQRNYATLGLSQNIKVTDKIKADISIDHAKTIGSTNRFNQNEAEAQGTQRDDYTAISVGLGSSEKDWSWTTRAEIREGDLNDKINLYAGLIRHLDDGKNLSSKISYIDSQKSDGDSSKTLKISLGSAWHPKAKDFVFFSRLDLIDERSVEGNDESHTQKVVHNLHYNRKFNEKTQLSVHHGIKQIFDDSNGASTDATVDTATIELRRDISKSWDIGAHAGYLHDWTEKNTKTVAGVSVGVTPAENAWIQLGINFEGFDDSDFDGSDYKRKGIYTSFSYKFDEETLRNKKKKKERTYTAPVKVKAKTLQIKKQTEIKANQKVNTVKVKESTASVSTKKKVDSISPSIKNKRKTVHIEESSIAEKDTIKYVNDLFEAN